MDQRLKDQKQKKVSIIIPVYNEALAISEVLRRVCVAPLGSDSVKEIIIVDDGSIDSTLNCIEEFIAEHPQYRSMIRLHTGLINHGKGAALRAGFRLATGDIILIQDGDLEYYPQDYPKLLEPFQDPTVQVVYGSRFMHGFAKGMRFPNLVANIILTLSTRILYAQKITDEATGYKVFRRSVLQMIKLNCLEFEFCPEFTSKVLRAGLNIVEVPISYNPRGILEGKKIRARDGFIALWWLIKFRFVASSTFLRSKDIHSIDIIEEDSSKAIAVNGQAKLNQQLQQP
jgi:dolichol-phosphate mannosyltransferase